MPILFKLVGNVQNKVLEIIHDMNSIKARTKLPVTDDTDDDTDEVETKVYEVEEKVSEEVETKVSEEVEEKVSEEKEDVSHILRLSNIIDLFKSYGLTDKDFDHVKFVANSETIKDNDKAYVIHPIENLLIFVFTADKNIKDTLINIFTKYATKPEVVAEPTIKLPDVDPELQKHIADSDSESDEEQPILSPEIVKQINLKTKVVFDNPDFKHLIRIYYSNPDLIKTFISFVSHGDIVKLTIPDSPDEDYTEQLSEIKALGIEESDEVIITTLKTFNGHLNLSLRYLLCRKAISFD